MDRTDARITIINGQEHCMEGSPKAAVEPNALKQWNMDQFDSEAIDMANSIVTKVVKDKTDRGMAIRERLDKDEQVDQQSKPNKKTLKRLSEVLQPDDPILVTTSDDETPDNLLRLSNAAFLDKMFNGRVQMRGPFTMNEEVSGPQKSASEESHNDFP
uniref:Non-structural maintenance of chromosomes element 4 n=1 Tax=Steinernema glaseri TaxID=37863 RepID=A0A1I7ZJY5_9BILA